MRPSTVLPSRPAGAGADGLPAPVAIPPEEQSVLLDIAHAALAVACGARPAETLDRVIAAGPLPERPAGAFVTLTEGGVLRGCMGSLAGDVAVWVSVADAAAWAARSDPRFVGVEPDELARIHLDVSVLGPFVPLADPLAFRLGVDGVLVARGGRRGLLLPEVAPMAGLDQAGMLDTCCDKAGLRRGSWREPGTEVFAFRTCRFGGPAAAA